MPSPSWPLPICLDSWTWHSSFLGNITLYSIRLYFHHQPHPQLGVVFCFGSISSFFLELFLHSSKQHIGHLQICGVHFSVSYLFAFSYCSWGSQGKNTEVVCHSILQWTTFCRNSTPWPIHLGWPYIAWLIVSLNWTQLFSLWSVWLIFCDCGFHCVCPLVDKDKRLIQAS